MRDGGSGRGLPSINRRSPLRTPAQKWEQEVSEHLTTRQDPLAPSHGQHHHSIPRTQQGQLYSSDGQEEKG